MSVCARAVVAIVACIITNAAIAQTPLPVADDPLVRMPGTQPGDGVGLEAPDQCLNCHADYASGGQSIETEPGQWRGSMMAQAARDPIFYACMAVAAQDSQWALGRPNAMDLCLRCHFPEGWLEGRSATVNGSAMTGSDFDGVHCDVCHRMYDPFFKTTFDGSREGNDWPNYWDESNASATPSTSFAAAAVTADQVQANTAALFNGNDFYDANGTPFSLAYTENASGQFYVSASTDKRGPFTDAAVRHGMVYSRYHKSKFFCSTCHDVSNPALANLGFDGTTPGDGTTILPSEQNAAHSYFHVERTFSEFMLSAYGQQGGAPGTGAFAPEVFDTSRPGNAIASCQDCHMRDIAGDACDKPDAIQRPTGSVEHPASGVPQHDLTGGNMLVPYLLASATIGSPNFDLTNSGLLNQGSSVLTLDMGAGLGANAQQLLGAVERARTNLENAASIEDFAYNAQTGGLTFRVVNHTGHKLISGFPEGRRMFVNIRAYAGESLLHEINPYDSGVGTLKGLPASYSPSSPALTANETHMDELVYEVHPSSSISGEEQTFHFVLADGRSKDNRIPPMGFDIVNAPARLCEPVWGGLASPNLFTAAEYAGGYDEAAMLLAPGADRVEISLYYQTTSREYVEFLRDEINGTDNLTLPGEAYIAQTDAFFEQLAAWGDTIWQLWEHNQAVPGAAPVLMAAVEVTPLTGAEVHANFDYAGIEIGTAAYPYNTLAEAAAFVSEGGTIGIVSGHTPETPIIVKPMRVEVEGLGLVRIGTAEI